MTSSNFSKAMKDLKNGFLLYPIWIPQAFHILAAKYRRTILGTFWLSANFIITSLSVAFVFGALFNLQLRDFLPYCMLGNLFATTALWIINEAPELFMINSGLIKNNATPFTYYVFESIAKLLMLMAINLAAYYIIIFAFGYAIIPNPVFLLGLSLLILCILPWGCLIGMLSARYRDLRYLLPNLSMFIYFTTPIYWHPTMLGEHGYIAQLNPLYHLVSIVREPLLGNWPTPINWYVSIIIAITGIIGWLIFFSTFRRKIPFWV